MYLPDHFAEQRSDILQQLIHDFPLATLITQEADGLCANHIPFIFSPPDEQHPHGVLHGHVARANPVWQNRQEALLVFQGASSYITPSWYPEKRQTGAVVPTYNYAVVHAKGTMRTIEEPQQLLALLTRLTDHFESSRADRWQVSDAPGDYLQNLMAMIVGIEIPLTSLSGKWKTSQNRSVETRSDISAGLREQHDDASQHMAAIIENQLFDQNG